MAGRKRKIPLGYIPQWSSDNTDSESELLGLPPASERLHEPSTPSVTPSVRPSAQPPAPPSAPPSPDLHENQDTASIEGQDQLQILPTCDFDAEDGRAEDDGSDIIMAESLDNIGFYSQDTDTDTDLFQKEHDQQHEEENEKDDNEEDGQYFYVADGNLDVDSTADPDEYFNISSDNESQEEEDKTSYQYLLAHFAEEWMLNEVNHKVSKSASSDFWNVAAKWMFSISSAFNNEKKNKFPKFGHIRKKLKKQYVPRISLDTAFINKETKELTIAEDTERIPVKDFPPDKFEKVFEIASVQVWELPHLRISCLLEISIFFSVCNIL